MKKSNISFLTLAFGLLLGLSVSLLPVTPALSDTLPVCQGTPGSSNTQVILGGRVIKPGLILQGSGGSPCPAGEATLSLVSFSRTIIVSPQNNPVLNGEALQYALAILSSKNPSASNPWLLKLEPGNYDLGNTSFTMLPYVDLEGSGEDITTITSSFGLASLIDSAALVAASNSTVRFLSIVNSGPNNSQVAVLVGPDTTNARFDHLTTRTSCSGFALCTGIYINGGLNGNSVFLQNSTLTTTETNNSGGSLSFYIKNNGTATIQNTTITASGNASSNAGVYNNGGTLIIQNSTITASGGASSYGIEILDGTTMVGASELSGTTAASSGSATCVASYRANFTPLSSTCL